MALISIPSWVTDSNRRLPYLKTTLESIAATVNFDRHRVFVIDNGSNRETRDYYEEAGRSLLPFTLIQLEENTGTARAINQAWKLRTAGEHCIKVDSDVKFHERDWADRLVDCVERDATIGICGLKRVDCIESPTTDGWYKSELRMLPHTPGQRWLIVEVVNHVIGTACLFNSLLLDKIGYLYQSSWLYGLDDGIAAARSVHAGFYNCFYSHALIAHVDAGDTPYQQWKEQYAAKNFPAYHRFLKEYRDGTKSIYNGPEDD